MKKLLVTGFLLFSVLLLQGQITFTTSSTSSDWSPSNFTNNGSIPTWEASGTGIVTQQVTANLPAFDFSSNNGSDIFIICTSPDDFAGLTTLYVSDKDLSSLDVSAATSLTSLSFRDNNVSGDIDLSLLTALTSLWLGNNDLTDLDISTNTNLNFLSAENNLFSSSVLDNILNNLDSNGLSNGTLRIIGNSPLAIESELVYNSLVSKGWSIDVSGPIVPSTETISFISNSISSSWSPSNFTNSGAIPTWEASGSGIVTQQITANLPNFDFSSNDGSDIFITCTSTDAFAGLTTLYVSNRDLRALNVSAATSLTSLSFRDNNISGIVDLSSLTNLSSIWLANNNLTDLDISNNTNLTFVSAQNSELSSEVVDKVINDLDGNGASNGTLRIVGNSPLTLASQPSYDNLIGKIWLIDVSAPIAPITETITFTTNSTSSSWSPSNFTNSGNIPTWEATGSGIATQQVTANLPDFDFSLNDGSDIFITCTSTDAFAGLTTLYLSNKDLSTIDVSAATSLTSLSIRDNNIDGLVDLSLLTNLSNLWLGNNNLTDLDISSNTNLTFLSAENNEIPSAILDEIINDLDVNGEINGILRIAGNESLTSSSLVPYNSLVDDKGWTIDVDAPNPPGPQINVTGNGIDIVSSAPSNALNGSDFESVIIGSPVTNQFTVENTGDEDLIISLFFNTNPLDFTSTTPNLTIPPGGSETFDVSFNAVSEGVKNGSIIIQNNDIDVSDAVFVLVLSGEGVTVLPNQIMITQYYNGAEGSNWIEVVNISESILTGDSYFLSLYNQGSNLNSAPDEFESIPELDPGELVLFSNTEASLPLAGNLGVAVSDVIRTDACNFTSGQDIVLVSTTTDASCYENRVDIVGTEGGWSGTNISYIRGGNSNELPEIDFNIANWIPLSPSADVNVAVGTTNVMLGTQNVGSTSWDGSWDNSQPDRTRNASISGTYTALNGNIEAYNLVVESGTNLNFNNGTSNSVVVYGDLTISDSGNFIIGDQESLVMLNNSSSVSGNITKIENSASRNTDRDITYWSSSVTNATISTVFTGVTSSRIWGYDQSQTAESIPPDDPRDPTSTYWNVWQVASGLMVPGFGYAAEGLTGSSDVHTVSFTGVPNNGVIQFDVFEQADGNIDNDFNLIGNPYASAIDMDAFLELNGTINGVIFPEIYLWTHTNPLQPIYDTGVDFLPTDYAIRNIGGGVGVAPGADPLNNIGSGQGFMVRASESGGGLLQFTNPMRLVDENTQFFKQSNSKKKSNAVAVNETDRIWLNLTSDKQGFNQMLVVFTERASDDIDMGFDSRVFENGKPIMLYSNIEGSKYAIQGLGEFSEDKEIALGFDANVSNRVLTIGIDKLEGKLVDAKIYLVDNLLNVTHDLQKGDYTFDQAESGSFPDRFTLKFTRSNAGGNGNGNGKSMKVSNKFETLKIEATDPVRMIKVYDVFGRLIVVKEPNESTFDINIENVKPGTVLILESVLEDGTVLNKKSIKY